MHCLESRAEIFERRLHITDYGNNWFYPPNHSRRHHFYQSNCVKKTLLQKTNRKERRRGHDNVPGDVEAARETKLMPGEAWACPLPTSDQQALLCHSRASRLAGIPAGLHSFPQRGQAVSLSAFLCSFSDTGSPWPSCRQTKALTSTANV